MNDINYKDIPYKNLLVILITSAILYQFGYWSTFRLNVLGYMTLNDMISSFIYPFLGTFLSYTLYLFTDYFQKILVNISDSNKSNLYFPTRKIIFYILFAAFLVISSFYLGVYAWIIVPFFAWSVYSRDLVLLFIENNTIPINLKLARFIQITLLLFLMSFCLGKRDGLLIHKNLFFDYIQTFDVDSTKKSSYKILGNFGDFLFLESLDNTEKIVSKLDKYQPLKIYHYYDKKITSKRDSLIMDKIRLIKK